jgi:ribose transport system ATP-binding protein
MRASASELLRRVGRQLRSEGIAIVYISHRMEEVLSLADRITVLRDGRHVGDLDRDTATHEKIVSLMVGRELSANYFPDRPERVATETALRGGHGGAGPGGLMAQAQALEDRIARPRST